MEPRLGLCDPPSKKTYLFVGEASDKCLWYFLAPDTDEKIPVHEQAVCGTLADVRIVEKEFKGKPVFKLDLEVRADRRYVVRSGLDTNFSRCILLALERVEDLAGPLYFCVRPSDENEKVVFGSVYTADGERVRYEWDGKRDVRPVVATLRRRLGLDEQHAEAAANSTAPSRNPPAANGNGKKEMTLAEAHEGVHKVRQLLVKRGFETWKSLNEMLGRDFGLVSVEELTREDAVKYGTALKELYERHVAEAVRT